MAILEKSWTFKIPFTRAGKVMRFSIFIKNLGKVMMYVGLLKCVTLLYSSTDNVELCEFLQRDRVSTSIDIAKLAYQKRNRKGCLMFFSISRHHL